MLQPGERSALYHAENAQEGFLVLAGECIAIVEEQERTLRPWDYLHCPAGTAHAFVGAGDGPCAILMVGARKPDATIDYPASEAAARHGLSMPVPSDTRGTRTKRRLARASSRPMPMPWPALTHARGAQRQLAGGARASAGREVAARHDVDPLEPEPARHRSSSARSSAAVSGGASGSACAACTRSAPPWRSALRSTRATSRSPSRNGST